MNYVELSSKDVENKTSELYNKILSTDYKFDLVIFIAKGSYTIGKKLSELGNCPLLEIKATRKGNKLKKIVCPFLKLIPKKIKMYLRNKEVKSNIHEKNIERNVIYNVEKWSKYKECKNIILVDDSVDTGYSIKACKEEIERFFPNSNIKVAAFNYFEKSENIIKVDYSIYKEMMMNGPWSNDSKYHKEFLKEYDNWILEKQEATMKLLLILESHFFIDKHSDVWCDRVVDYNFLKRYMSSFSEIVVCGRTDTINNEKYKLKVTGPSVSFRQLPNFYGIKGLIKNIFKIRKLIRSYSKEVDVVLYRVPTPLSLFTYKEVLRQRKVLGVEFMISADKMIEGNGIIKNFLNKRIDNIAKNICKKANGVSYVTDYVLQKKYPSNSIINGKETNEYFATSYSTIELEKDNLELRNWYITNKPNEYKIIHTGFMDTYRKGQDILIRALKILIDDGYNVSLTLIGDGKKRLEFEKLAKDLNILDKVNFTGSIKDKQKIYDYLKNSHLLVFPTESEGLPRTIIEAMAVGLPCVSSPVDGIVELLEPDCLVQERTPEKYAEKIEELLSDWNSMINIGKQNYEKALKYEKSILDIKRQDFYSKLCNLAKLKKQKR